MANGVKKIDQIIKSTLTVIEESKGAIFDIAESSRREVTYLKEEIKRLQAEVKDVIRESDAYENLLQKSKVKLLTINKDFGKYSQEDMKKAYEEADGIRVKLAVTREREKQTILRRNEVERRLKNANDTVDKAEKLVAQVGTVLDYLTGDLKRLDDYLGKAESKKALAIRIIKTQEDERRRIAREMHDGPAQAMSSVVLKAEICEKLAEMDLNKSRAELTNLKEIVRECLKDVRRIIYDLRPMSIDDLGLKPTLQKYIENFSRQTGMRIDLNFRGDDQRLKDSNITLAVFRVVQESLNNAKKHAHTYQISVYIELTEKGITLRVKDDGRGFDVNALQESQRTEQGGFGVFGMKERVELLGGVFAIESEIGKGTAVKVQLPYELQGGM